MYIIPLDIDLKQAKLRAIRVRPTSLSVWEAKGAYWRDRNLYTLIWAVHSQAIIKTPLSWTLNTCKLLSQWKAQAELGAQNYHNQSVLFRIVHFPPSCMDGSHFSFNSGVAAGFQSLRYLPNFLFSLPKVSRQLLMSICFVLSSRTGAIWSRN